MRLRPILASSAVALLLLGCGDAEPIAETPAASAPDQDITDVGAGSESEEPATEVETPEPTTEDEPAEPAEGAADADGDPDDDQETDDTTEVVPFAVRATDRAMFVEPHPMSVVADDDATDAELLIRSLLSLVPVDDGLSTMIPRDVELLAASVTDDVLTVDLSAEVRDLAGGSATELAFVQQLAHTATQLPGVRAVQLLVEGEPIESLTGHVDLSVPVEPDPFALSPVTITNPVDGQTIPVGSTITLTGQATVFEATVVIEVAGPSGTETAFTTATEGAPGRGTYTHELVFDEPGTYTITVSASDPSDGEGPPPFSTSITVDVTP